MDELSDNEPEEIQKPSKRVLSEKQLEILKKGRELARQKRESKKKAEEPKEEPIEEPIKEIKEIKEDKPKRLRKKKIELPIDLPTEKPIEKPVEQPKYVSADDFNKLYTMIEELKPKKKTMKKKEIELPQEPVIPRVEKPEKKVRQKVMPIQPRPIIFV